jgi:glycosyltransferase involved in cell wall biosynthesis
VRIAQIAPLAESVPPKLYGGTERVVAHLCEALLAQGHEVTLFASGDSTCAVELLPCAPQALRLGGWELDPLPYLTVMLDKVRHHAPAFDILHFHIDYLHFPLVRSLGLPALTTLHGRLDLPVLAPIFAEFSDLAMASISQAQRQLAPQLNWLGTVPHGLPLDLHRFTPRPATGYLAFLGRICPEKRPDRAIEIAQRTGLELRIAAKVDPADRAYFKSAIEPLLDHPLIRFEGEISDADKSAFLGNARALLFPIDWPEPFGLAMIEAMACGTPVIAYLHGAVPEVVDHGVTGWLVESQDQAVAAVHAIDRLDRAAIRARFERRFSAARMASDYLALYRRLLKRHGRSLRAA